MTGVKICGITCREDARVAAEAGARYIGAVLYAGSPRNVEPDQARDFARGLDVALVVVVANEPVATVVDWARRTEAAVVQLHGDETPAQAEAVTGAGPWSVWKAVRARTPEAVWAAVRDFGPVVSGLLVDAWHPRRLGGTGRRVRWGELPGLADRMPAGVDLIAAGGLGPTNVAEVVARIRPQVVDVSSGVERAPGRKDPEAVRRFVAEATRPVERGRAGR